ncbi:hypothetical protein ANN_10663 [Periplaneta americana]|uniref:Uncharacterized protein n=1 Tax=Periplaneta americana TaxID=6978 RepID=A0ABQ8T2Y0_PERAM|nr:hypothetical protein ANN_10663 [Periplaneta americana]
MCSKTRNVTYAGFVVIITVIEHWSPTQSTVSSSSLARSPAESRSRAGDNAGEMCLGSNTESYLAFARIGLRENPGKNLNQVTCPDRDSNPGHLVSQPDALTVTPQVVLYGGETWTLNSREEQRLRVFENNVLGKIFGAKRDKVTGEW